MPLDVLAMSWPGLSRPPTAFPTASKNVDAGTSPGMTAYDGFGG